MKGKIFFTIGLTILFIGWHFYAVPSFTAQAAVNQLKDTPMSTGDVRTSVLVADYAPILFIVALVGIWYSNIAKLFKNEN